MTSLFNMYQDTPQVDISGTLANLRKEEKDRRDKNWQGSKDLLRGAATDAIRSKYADQIEWDKGVDHADEVFKVQYERLMAVDPQAAAQLAQEYKAEREKRINKVTADAYKAREEDPSLQALEAEIAALQASIQTGEAKAQEEKQNAEYFRQEELRAPQEEAMQGYNPGMQGYTPQPGANSAPQALGSGLRSFYGAYPSTPKTPGEELVGKYMPQGAGTKIRPPYLTDIYEGGL